MAKDKFISFCFIALLLFIVYQVFWIFSPFFRAIFWAGILSFGFFPIYKKFREFIRTRNVVSALLMTLLIFLVVIPPVIWMVINLAGQAIQLYQTVSQYLQSGRFEQLVEQIRSTAVVQGIEHNVFQWEPFKRDTSEWMLRVARTVGNFASVESRVVTRNIFFVVLNIFLTFFLVFIFFKDGEKIYSFVYKIAPLEEKNKQNIFNEINGTFAAVIRGQMLTALAQATIAGIVFWSLGLPLPVFFAAVTFVGSLIPIMGASSVWVPLVLYLFALGFYIKALILLLLGVFVISLIDNVMKPALIGEKTKLPYFLLFFGILGGLKIYGLMGIFIAPVVLSLFFAVVKIYEEKYLSQG